MDYNDVLVVVACVLGILLGYKYFNGDFSKQKKSSQHKGYELNELINSLLTEMAKEIRQVYAPLFAEKKGAHRAVLGAAETIEGIVEIGPGPDTFQAVDFYAYSRMMERLDKLCRAIRLSSKIRTALLSQEKSD